MYKIEFYPEARLDLAILPADVKKEVADFIKTFSTDQIGRASCRERVYVLV